MRKLCIYEIIMFNITNDYIELTESCKALERRFTKKRTYNMQSRGKRKKT